MCLRDTEPGNWRGPEGASGQGRPSFSDFMALVVRWVLVLAMMVTPIMGRSLDPQTKKEGAVRETKAVPWLVTIIYELSVKDLISELRAQGLSVTPFEGIAESRLITNVASGLVMDQTGHILGRLTNFRIKPKPDWLTIITSDGRRLKPKAVEYDPASGYSVLEVPELAIEPPRFASAAPARPTDSLRLLYQLPVWAEAGLSGGESKPVIKAREKLKQEALTLQRSDQGGGPSMAIRVIEDTVPLALSQQGAAVTESLKKALLDIRRLNAPDGSVVINREGEVVGLMEFLDSAKAMVKPIDSLRSLASRLVTRNQARRGWIGVRLAELPQDEVPHQLKAPCTPRLVVREVLPDSPAAHVGIKPDDGLCQFNGQEVQTLRELTQALAQIPVGTEVPIGILRQGELKHLVLRIEARPQVMAWATHRHDQGRKSGEERESDGTRTWARSSSEAPMPSSSPSSPAGRAAQLGIEVERLTSSLREFFGVAGSGGVLITEVRMDSPAGRSGLRAGDVIVMVNGRRVASPTHLDRLLTQASGPGKLSLSLIRHRQPVEITLEVP